MENTNPTYPFLPESIIYLILLCLPVKSLLRFKSVCKSWLSLISAPDFVENHLLVSTYDPYMTYHRLILAKQLPGSQLTPRIFDLLTCSLYSLLRENLTKSMCCEPVIDSIEDEINGIVGSCNGIVCLVNVVKQDRHVVLWNPSTRKSRRLPKFDMIREYDDCVYYGFCFDEISEDFKVFAMSGFDKFELSVYSSKSDSWRLIGDFTSGRVVKNGKFANGAMYWVAWERIISDEIIVSFDIKTEKYREIMLPKQIYEEDKRPLWILDTFRSSPYILYVLGTRVDFWLEERGAEESWTKWFTIPYTGPPDRYLHKKLICIFENGDIMLSLCETIVMYNSQDKTFERLLNFNVEGLEVYHYVESLVSP